LSRNFLGLSLVMLGKLSDEELMSLVKEKDHQKAYEHLYKRHRKAVMTYMGNLIYDRSVVEEVAQEAFFKLYRHRSQYIDAKALKPWLWTIARNTALDYLRKKRDLLIEDMTSNEDERDAISLIKDEGNSAEELLIQKAGSEEVQNILNKLPETQKEILSLASLSELSYEEISEMTGSSLSSIKSTLFRARKRFIEEYKKQMKDEK
jgi:RNA polymerase sigma-70 factor (ECF subfamily)